MQAMPGIRVTCNSRTCEVLSSDGDSGGGSTMMYECTLKGSQTSTEGMFVLEYLPKVSLYGVMTVKSEMTVAVIGFCFLFEAFFPCSFMSGMNGRNVNYDGDIDETSVLIIWTRKVSQKKDSVCLMLH